MPDSLSVAHLWQAYPPAHRGDPHPYLLAQGARSRVLAYEAIDTAVAQGPDVTVRHFVDPEVLSHSSSRRGVWHRAKRRADWGGYVRECNQTLLVDPPDLLHAHFGTTAARILPVVQAVRAPLVVSFYGWDVTAALQQPRWRNAISAMLPHVSLSIVHAEDSRDRLVGIGCPPEGIRLWRIPAGVEMYDEHTPRRYDGELHILYAARFVEQKGCFVVLEAFERLVAGGQQARLTMMGYGPLVEEVARKVAAGDMKDKVTVVDTRARADFHQIFNETAKQHDIFVHASFTGEKDYEAGPALTAVAAQAAGLPLVTTPYKGSELHVEDGVTGWFTEARDPVALAERLAWFGRNPEMWARVGAAGSRLVRARFSYEPQMAEMLGFYHEVAGT